MASALDMLRHYSVKKKLHKIKDAGDHLLIGKLDVPKKMKTNWMASGPKQEGTPEKFYTLDSLVFFLQHADAWEKSYVRNANYKNISIIHEEDREAILAYFNGHGPKSVHNPKPRNVLCNAADDPAFENVDGNPRSASAAGIGPAEKHDQVQQQSVQAENVQFVRSLDRVNVLKYLNGELDSIPNLNENVMYASPFGAKRPITDSPTERPTELTNDLSTFMLQKIGDAQNKTGTKGPLEGPFATSGRNLAVNSAECDLVETLMERPVETKLPPPKTDPLTMLRQYIVEEKQITVKDSSIIFGDWSWPKNARTNYLIWGSGRNGKPKEYYTLECLMCFLRNVSQRHPAYVNQARIEKVPFVKRPDRKKLLDYLKGVSKTSDSLDKSVPAELPTLIKHKTSESLNENIDRPHREVPLAKSNSNNVSKNTEWELISLPEALSLETIAAIKAKRLANKLKN